MHLVYLAARLIHLVLSMCYALVKMHGKAGLHQQALDTQYGAVSGPTPSNAVRSKGSTRSSKGRCVHACYQSTNLWRQCCLPWCAKAITEDWVLALGDSCPDKLCLSRCYASMLIRKHWGTSLVMQKSLLSGCGVHTILGVPVMV